MPHIPDTRHADHDRLLVAAHAAGDATGPELDEALALVATCADCAALHHDLRAIAAALPALPAPVRPRDFRLTPGQAASLRPAGWRRFLAPLAGPRFAFAGPLGTGLATLGIAGLLVAGSLGAPLAKAPAAGEGQGAGIPTASIDGTGGMAGQAVPADGASPDAVLKAPEQASEPHDRDAALPAELPGAPSSAASVDPETQYSNANPAASAAAAGPDAPARAGPAETSLPGAQPTVPNTSTAFAVVLPVTSGLLLLAGLVLAGLRLASRRIGARG